MNKHIQYLICFLIALGCLNLLLVNFSFAQCKPPKFRNESVWDESKSKILMGISIKIEDFAPDRLACLASVLKQRYHDRKEIIVFIFSSHWAARNYYPQLAHHMATSTEQYKAEAHWRGTFLYNEDKGEEYIEFNPKGDTKSYDAFKTQIDLRVPSKSQCRLQINGRCLLALDDIDYPFDAKKERVTGTVTLAGTIDSQGIMTGVTIAESNITPVERKILLENDALENIKTWRFERSDHQAPFRITYSYSIDAPKGYEGMTEVEPVLPDYIYIRVKPWDPSPR